MRKWPVSAGHVLEVRFVGESPGHQQLTIDVIDGDFDRTVNSGIRRSGVNREVAAFQLEGEVVILAPEDLTALAYASVVEHDRRRSLRIEIEHIGDPQHAGAIAKV